jgi:hypothetical protein
MYEQQQNLRISDLEGDQFYVKCVYISVTDSAVTTVNIGSLLVLKLRIYIIKLFKIVFHSYLR